MSDWNTFLNTHYPQLTESSVPEWKAETTYLVPLHTYGLLSIQGPDAVKFLQGQVTCDVRELADQQTRLGAHCNNKGRMLLCFRALQPTPENILLRTHASLIAQGLGSLGKYIVFSKAKLVDVSNNYRGVGISGPKAGEVVKSALGVTIDTDGQWQSGNDALVIRIDGARYECWIAADRAEAQWQSLAALCTPTHGDLWQLLNIQAGIGDISSDTYESFTPQAINFQLVGGINFRKGCYTGQEIVARLHYRGNLKRHMFRFEFLLGDNPLPTPGSALCDEAGKSLGEVVIAARKNATHGELLANTIDGDQDNLYLGGTSQKLTPLPLPYAIPTSSETGE